VGWPVEYAAGLIGLKVNCTDLMRAGEVGDEEASAVSAALTTLRETWGGEGFTAKMGANAITPESEIEASFLPTNSADTDRAKAEAIADALGELAGRRLKDRPTAQQIGKLFQKCLVDRPAWIGDHGQTVAVLRKTPGHSENAYHIDVRIPGP